MRIIICFSVAVVLWVIALAIMQESGNSLLAPLVLVGNVFWADGVATIAQGKGYGRFMWFVIGFFINILGLIGVLVLPETQKVKDEKLEQNRLKEEESAARLTRRTTQEALAKTNEVATPTEPVKPSGPNPNLCVGCGALMAPSMTVCPKCKMQREAIG